MMVRLNRKPYTVTRTLVGVPVNGRKVAGVSSSVPIVANVQPLSGEELEVLPEARRTLDVQMILTETELYPATPTHEPDRITIRGNVYEVFKVAEWPRHWCCYASKLGNP